MRGLTAEELAAFEAGKDEFEEVETIEEGLGPVFNGRSCAGCHDTPGLGGDSGAETRFDHVRTKGNKTPDADLDDVEGNPTSDREAFQEKGNKFDPLENLGGSLIQRNGIGPIADCVFGGEVVPHPEANVQ